MDTKHFVWNLLTTFEGPHTLDEITYNIQYN